MKRNSFLAFCAFVAAFCITVHDKLHAQEEQSIWLGAFGGVDRGKLSYSSDVPNESSIPESEWKSRAYFGIESDIWFTEHWAIMIRPTYAEKGTYEYSEVTTTINGEEKNVNATQDVTLTYFQLPIGVRAMFGEGQFKASFFFATTVDFLLSAENHITYEGYSDTTVTMTDVGEMEIGLVAGTSIGYMFESGISVFAEAVYDYGIGNIYRDKANAPSASTRDYRFGLSMFFQIK